MEGHFLGNNIAVGTKILINAVKMAVSWIKTIKKAFPLIFHCDYVVTPMMTNGHVF